jgi:hypothetical protein
MHVSQHENNFIGCNEWEFVLVQHDHCVVPLQLLYSSSKLTTNYLQ